MARITLRLDADLVQWCEQLALERGITLNQLISDILSEFIRSQPQPGVKTND